MQKLHLKWHLDVFTLFNAAQRDIECFNQLQMHIFLHFKHKTLNTDIYNYFKNENKLKCEIKSPVGGRKSLVISDSLRLNRII